MADITDDTICAIATPIGEGGIGVVRVSGAQALTLCTALLRLRGAIPLDAVPSHTVRAADLLLPSGGGPIDEILVTVMRAPRSYTGEDVIELSCHGNPLILEMVCEALLQGGARLAEPGEFTRRAFLNGRLDLAQAEAVLDTITARTAGALRVAQEQLRGRLSETLSGVRERLMTLLAHVEAGIDFVEEDISFISEPELLMGIDGVTTEIERLADSFREGRILRDGLAVVIVGRPNVGKSSLLNALLQRDRAIVTAIPGTTRDVLEETVNIRGIPVRLLDTAGIRGTADAIEQEGITRSRASLETADLVLLILDSSEPLTHDDAALIEETRTRARLVVINKSDLPAAWRAADVRGLDALATVALSAKTGDGLDTLRDTIRRATIRPEFEPGERPIVTHLRHRTALRQSADALRAARRSVIAGEPAECVAMDLRGAIDVLGGICGVVTTDDILDRVFRDFCIGK